MKREHKGFYPFFSTNSFGSHAVIMLVLCAALAMMLLGGCATAKFVKTGPSFAAKPDDCDIEVFSSKIPDREYVELGILEGEGFLGGDSMEMILPKMKREACRAGGDAIILKTYQKVGDDSFDDNLNVTATVIKWTE
jgi:hypothetical protein